MTTSINQNEPPISPPSRRRLRAFAFDPMTSRLTGRFVNLDVRFEHGLKPGPVGELLEVLDYDASQGRWYQPVDLDDPAILSMGGLQPSETDPRTHQQVVYAVAMNVIERFERFGGRRFRWRGKDRLRLLPHAFEGANAFFDPSKRAVLFGYYRADAADPGRNLPEQTEFTCLSVDIVAHEVTHAIVDRLRPHFSEPTNPDVFAWHEAFADLVALFHHFVFPDALARALANSRGDLGMERGNALLNLAQEFGESTGRGAALRSAIGSPRTPDAFLASHEPHERGACFVAAVFDAYLDTYQAQIADLSRLATGGSGVLPAGALHPDLVNRLTVEALRNADRMLGMVVRAFEFLPVVDVTFGDVVRAIVTADRMLFPDDVGQLRSTLVEALRRRGIVPVGVTSLAEEALTWSQPKDLSLIEPLADGRSVDLSKLILSATQNLDVNGAASYMAPKADGDKATPPRPPRRLTMSEASEEGDDGHDVYSALHAWGLGHAHKLGLDPQLDLRVDGGHVSYFQAADGQPRPVVVVQFTQERKDLSDRIGIPVRAGTTVIARIDGGVEFVVAKPLPLSKPATLDSISTDAVLARGFHKVGEDRLAAISEWADRAGALDPLSAWTDEAPLKRLTFASLHASEILGGI